MNFSIPRGAHLGRLVRLAATVPCLLLAIPALASASDFCVGGPAGCSGTPVAANDLKASLTAAESNGSDDRFLLAPGVYAADTFSHQSVEGVRIIGAGAGKTIVRGDADGSVLTLGGNPDSSVSDLTLEPIGAATSGLTLQATRADGVAVDAAGAASLQAGVRLLGDATFGDGSVDIGAMGQYAVLVLSGDGTVTDSILTAHAGAGLASAGGEVTVRRSTLDAKFGTIAAKGHLTVSDTLVDLRDHAVGGLAVGVYTSPNSGGAGTTTATADAERLTIVGSTPGTGDSVGVYAYADGPGLSAGLRMRDSVISGIGVPVVRQGMNGATADLAADRSAYPSAIANFDTGPGSLVEHGGLNVSPGFVDGAGGDFRLAAGSPLIDAGTPDALPADAADRDGKPRASDGDGDCSHVPDVGAFELQGSKLKAVAATGAASAKVGEPVAFSSAGSCIPGPGAPHATWRFDDGATAGTASPTHAFATPGRRVATLTVTDGSGRSASATAVVDVAAATTPAPAGGGAAPVLSGLTVSPSRIAIGKALPKLVTRRAKRPTGTITFTLSEAAKVKLRFARRSANGRFRRVPGRVRVTAKQGRNRVRFAGRLSRKLRLAPGAYRLTAVAVDAAGARSAPARKRFTAVRHRRP